MLLEISVITSVECSTITIKCEKPGKATVLGITDQYLKVEIGNKETSILCCVV